MQSNESLNKKKEVETYKAPTFEVIEIDIEQNLLADSSDLGSMPGQPY